MLYQKIARPVLFRWGKGDPEAAHAFTMKRLRRVAETPWLRQRLQRLNQLQAPVEVAGMHFPNPIGLAAGLDKNGEAVGAWPSLGFGFAEVGTVTAQAQPGNPAPRMFRLKDSRAIINRMGFNNEGARALANRLAASPKVNSPIGVSIGKTKITPVEDAVEDYLTSLRQLYPYASYFAVNVSSPNTPGLRQLQDASRLRELLGALYSEGVTQAAGRPLRPIFLKIAPDLTLQAISELLEVAVDAKVSGIIATNTTLTRDGIADSDAHLAPEAGGLSGRPLTEYSRSVVKFVHRETDGKLPIIGSGGLMTPDDVEAMFDAGASLVQLYTGFIYGGPGLVKQSVKRYRRRMSIPPAHAHSNSVQAPVVPPSPPPAGSPPPPAGSTPPPTGSTPPPAGPTPPPAASTPPPSGSTPPPAGPTPPATGATPPPPGAMPSAPRTGGHPVQSTQPRTGGHPVQSPRPQTGGHPVQNPTPPSGIPSGPRTSRGRHRAPDDSSDQGPDEPGRPEPTPPG